MYKVTVKRGAKIVEQKCFGNLLLASVHFDFLATRYIEQNIDWNVKIFLKENKNILRSC